MKNKKWIIRKHYLASYKNGQTNELFIPSAYGTRLLRGVYHKLFGHHWNA